MSNLGLQRLGKCLNAVYVVRGYMSRGWLQGFVKGGLVKVKAEGFQEKNESLQVQSERLKALSLVYIIIRKILFRHLRLPACFPLKLRSFTPRTLPHREELVLEPRL